MACALAKVRNGNFPANRPTWHYSLKDDEKKVKKKQHKMEEHAWAGLLAALQAADQEGSALWVGRRPSVLASPAAVVGAFAWGSRVYGTARPTSDWDVVCITTTSTSTTSSTPDPSSPTPPPREPGGDAAAGGVEGPYALYDDGHYNASFYSLPQWITAVRWLLPAPPGRRVCSSSKSLVRGGGGAQVWEHRHDALECAFLPPQHVRTRAFLTFMALARSLTMTHTRTTRSGGEKTKRR